MLNFQQTEKIMKKYFDVISRCTLFNGISGANLTSTLSCIGAKAYTYTRGEVIFHEKDKSRNIGIVLSGEVLLSRVDFYGNKSIIASVSPSELFGESFACAGVEPTIAALAAVSILREHLPKLRIRFINVVDLFKLQSITKHPHGLNDE